MKTNYSDILALTSEKPIWFDENGAPRYCKFEPNCQSKFYAHEVVLMNIMCQNCQYSFNVCLSYDVEDQCNNLSSLKDRINTNSIHYGDPPNIKCCPSGPSMNSVPLKILEYWEQNENNKWKWKRNSKFEVEIKPDWWNDGRI